MDNLCFKIDIVINECSKSLYIIKKQELNEEFDTTIFKKFTNGPLLIFVKSIQSFLKAFKPKNIYMLCVCLSQIQKCLFMYETNMLEKNTVTNFEKILCIYLIKRIQKCFYKLEDILKMLDITDIDEHPGIFIDRMNTVLNGLNNRDNFELIKPNIDKIVFQAIIIAKVSDKIDNLEITSSSKQVLKAIQNFNKNNITEKVDNFFLYDCLSSSLSILERKVNTTILNLIYKIFNDPFCSIKKLLKFCRDSIDIKYRKSTDLSSMISDLDKSTDVLIQIGLFSIACCKNVEFIIPLKCCICSLELLDSDLVPAIIEFYLDPISVVKKKFLKLVINHWICEICEMQKYLYKIIDPFAFAQTTFDISTSIIETIYKSDSNNNIDLHVKLLNGLNNFTKYIKNIFATKISKENELSSMYKLLKNALKEYNACLIFNRENSGDIMNNNESIKTKLLKRCEIVMKYLKNIQALIYNIMDDESLSKLDNTYILFKTNQYSKCLIQNDNLYDKDDYLNMLFSTVQVQKSFYNKSERGTSKIFDHQDNYVTNVVETIYDNTVTMDLTNILDNFIGTSFTVNNDNKTTVNIWEEIDIDTTTKTQDLQDINNKIKC